jgi:hypothetical protein
MLHKGHEMWAVENMTAVEITISKYVTPFIWVKELTLLYEEYKTLSNVKMTTASNYPYLY